MEYVCRSLCDAYLRKRGCAFLPEIYRHPYYMILMKSCLCISHVSQTCAYLGNVVCISMRLVARWLRLGVCTLSEGRDFCGTCARARARCVRTFTTTRTTTIARRRRRRNVAAAQSPPAKPDSRPQHTRVRRAMFGRLNWQDVSHALASSMCSCLCGVCAEYRVRVQAFVRSR